MRETICRALIRDLTCSLRTDRRPSLAETSRLRVAFADLRSSVVREIGRPLFAAARPCYAAAAMKSARPIALWLAAVILSIAAALLPSGAQAHGAHGHGSQPAAAAVTDVAAFDLSALSAAAVRFAGLASFVRKGVVPVVATARLACACAACLAGGLCGHAPSSCCATGLAPSPGPILPSAAARDPAPTRDGPCLSGIVPEAQIEPPRPLA
ncbi:hypothetical protein [Methylorubrum thiocyanatum]|uniref:Uncharacterized protein n=1 Tax=Methylorubrum thiocyanatum TaxID=47958 RepID=A0AA40VB32_9HYPH|nr:hypothetical protein [Methylorubrum thiocyanatum]MBA8912645.1 hypothetical protein [Methylorubrum thiocyanatum]